jgi:hypothetical protein
VRLILYPPNTPRFTAHFTAHLPHILRLILCHIYSQLYVPLHATFYITFHATFTPHFVKFHIRFQATHFTLRFTHMHVTSIVTFFSHFRHISATFYYTICATFYVVHSYATIYATSNATFDVSCNNLRRILCQKVHHNLRRNPRRDPIHSLRGASPFHLVNLSSCQNVNKLSHH